MESRSRWLVGSSSTISCGGRGRISTQARPARRRSPPLRSPARFKAVTLRNRKRARAAWASLSLAAGLSRRKFSTSISSSASRLTRWSSTSAATPRMMRPLSGWIVPMASASSVVLPEPFGPVTASRSGPTIRNESPSRTRRPFGQAKLTPSKVSTCLPAGSPEGGSSKARLRKRSTRASASARSRSASTRSRSARRVSLPPVSSAFRFMAPSTMRGCPPLAASRRPRASRLNFCSRADWISCFTFPRACSAASSVRTAATSSAALRAA